MLKKPGKVPKTAMGAWEGLCAPDSNPEHSQPAEYVFITSNTKSPILRMHIMFSRCMGFFPPFLSACRGRFRTGEQLTPGLNVSWENNRHFATPCTNGFPAKWHLRNERTNYILITCHNPDLVSAEANSLQNKWKHFFGTKLCSCVRCLHNMFPTKIPCILISAYISVSFYDKSVTISGVFVPKHCL